SAGDPMNAPLKPVLADFNGDGVLDLAVTNFGGASVSVLRGLSTGGAANGTFGPAMNYAVSGSPSPVATGDFNADGITDLAVGRAGGVDILLGNATGGMGNGTFAAAAHYPLANLGAAVLDLVVADFDNDGKADLGLALDDGTMTYFFGDGIGTVGNGQFLL